MPTGLSAFFMGLAGPMVRKVLTALGFGIVSYAGVSMALNAALSAAKSSLSAFNGEYLGIVQMSGVFTAMSIIAGALLARVSLLALKKLEILK